MLLSDKMTDQTHELSGQGAEDVRLQSVKKLSRKSCLKCLRGGDVLVCSNADCPIVVHMSCMPCLARFDDTGSFYCPYCLYKKALNECQQAKEQAVLAKKALVTFLDAKISTSSADRKISECLKRKNTDVATGDQNKNDCCLSKEESVEVHKFKQVRGAQQSSNPESGTLADNIKQAGPTTSIFCQGTHSATGYVRSLIANCDDTVNIARGHDNASTRLKPMQKKSSMDNTSNIQHKGYNSALQTQEGAQGDYTFSMQKANETVICEEPDNDCSPRRQSTVFNHSFEKRHKCRTHEEQSRLQKFEDTSYSATSGKGSLMCKERGNLTTEHQEYDGNLHAQAEMEKKLTDPHNPAKENIIVVCEEYMEGDYGSPKDKNFLCSQIARSPQNTCGVSNFVENFFRRKDEMQSQTTRLGNAVSFARTMSLGAPSEECDTVAMSKSSQESHSNNMTNQGHSSNMTNQGHSSNMTNQGRSKRKVQVPHYSELGDQSGESSGFVGSVFSENEEVNPGETRKKVKPTRTLYPPLRTPKRKKLPWSVHEVQALKEGVHKFSLTAKKNLPWRKVLEYGRHIFDGTRTPGDLKDKWKNLVGKACANSKQN